MSLSVSDRNRVRTSYPKDFYQSLSTITDDRDISKLTCDVSSGDEKPENKWK
jgi:hypothetical protein